MLDLMRAFTSMKKNSFPTARIDDPRYFKLERVPSDMRLSGITWDGFLDQFLVVFCTEQSRSPRIATPPVGDHLELDMVGFCRYFSM